MYVIHSQRTLLLCLDMFILSPLMGGVSPQTTSTSSKLLSCIKDFPVDFPVVNKNNILTYLKVQKKCYRLCRRGVRLTQTQSAQLVRSLK